MNEIKKEELKKKQKGITLIALVITIIVLLILAGISIATLTGENGILTRANDAKIKNEQAQIEEEIKLAYNAVQTDALRNNWDINQKAEALEKELQKEEENATVIAEENNLKISYKGYEMIINENGEIENIKKSSITINIKTTGEEAKVEADGTIVKEIKDNNVPIPVGFYYVGGNKETGLVISDSKEDENKGTTDEIDGNLKGNQFVWIPVKTNQTIEIEVSSLNDIQTLTINGEEQVVNGKTFNKTIENPDLNGLYYVEVTDTNGAKATSEKQVKTLYAQDMWIEEKVRLGTYFEEWTFETLEEFFEFYSELAGTSKEEFEKELADANYTVEEYIYETGLFKVKELDNSKTIAENQNSLKLKYIEEIDNSTSVEKYGGFYVGRYEAGKEENGTIEEGNNDLPPVFVQKNKYIYDTPQNIALKQAENMYMNSSSVKSTLMSGKDWDTTLNYICQNSEDGYLIAVSKDSKYGNINQRDSFWGVQKTGTYITISKQYNGKFCNIYDIVGNAFEFTTEKSGEYYIARGGCPNYDYNTYNYGAARIITGEERDRYYVWRPALFLK